MTTAPARKGWCPGAWRPMRSGDGLIVRVRLHASRLTLTQAASLARLARDHGNGEIDLTSRANIQLRGVQEPSLEALHHGLDAIGLLDADAAAESARNIIVDPFEGLAGEASGLDLSNALERALAAQPGLEALPAKFGFAIDPSSTPRLAGAPADIRLEGHPVSKLLLVLDGDDTGIPVSRADAPAIAAAIAATFAAHPAIASGEIRRMRRLRDRMLTAAQGRPRMERARPAVAPSIGRHLGGLLVAPPFGRLDAAQLAELASAAETDGLSHLRLTPWRAIVLPGGGTSLLAHCTALGLMAEATHALVGIEACTGKPGCPSATVETRDLARRLAPRLPARPGQRPRLHVSGCAKGCASRSAADLTLIGRDGAFDLVVDGDVASRPLHTGLRPDRLLGDLTSLMANAASA